MKRSRPSEKRAGAKPDPRQRPLFEGWSVSPHAVREPREGEPYRAEPRGQEER